MCMQSQAFMRPKPQPSALNPQRPSHGEPSFPLQQKCTECTACALIPLLLALKSGMPYTYVALLSQERACQCCRHRSLTNTMRPTT